MGTYLLVYTLYGHNLKLMTLLPTLYPCWCFTLRDHTPYDLSITIQKPLYLRKRHNLIKFPPNLLPPLRLLRNPTQNLQQRRFPRPIAPNDPHPISLLNLK
jgi:hypothetical protein